MTLTESMKKFIGIYLRSLDNKNSYDLMAIVTQSLWDDDVDLENFVRDSRVCPFHKVIESNELDFPLVWRESMPVTA